MAQPALTDIFGASAAINAGVLSVTLSELPGTLGATPSSEAILAAMSQAAETAQDTEPDTDMAVIKVPRTQVTRGGVNYTRYRYQHDYFTPVPDLDPGDL